MKSFRYALWLTFIFISTTLWAQPQELRTKAESTVDNIARIQARWEMGDQLGFAYLVAVSPTEAIFVTARHVVATEIGTKLVSSANITILTANDRRLKVGKVLIPDPLVDIAVLEVPLPEPLFFVSAVIGQKPMAGEPVWLFGFDQKLEFINTTGRVLELQSEAMKIAGAGGWKGSSGAPIFSASGLVGIYHKVDPPHGVAIPIETIQRIVQSAGKQWKLSLAFWINPSIQVSFIRDDALGLPVVSRLAGGGVYQVPGRHIVPSGDYNLEYDSRLMRCFPQTWKVNRIDAVQSIVITCKPQAAGEWRNNHLRVMLSEIGNGDYEFLSSSNNNNPAGYLKGRLIQTARSSSVFQAALYDLNGVAVSGMVTLLPGLREMVLELRGVDELSERVRR